MGTRSDQLLSIVFDVGRVVVAHIKNEGLDLASFVPAVVVDLLDEVALALDAPVGNLADLLRVERFPRLIVQVFVEGHDENGVDEVDEGVPNVAHIVQVQGQVEVVVCALVEPVDTFEQHLLCVLVGDVTYHDRRAVVLAVKDPV